jgi:hypothetical protein
MGINADKQATTIPSLYNAIPLAVPGSQGTSKEERKKKQASHVISIGFLKEGLDAIDATGISS